jgi:putative nucleotidyltransferase with HDIG domain
MFDGRNSSLVQALEHSNAELVSALDSAVETFARLIDLRDGQPPWQNIQVAEIAASLARAMGVSIPDLPHIRRGALLHDIGKIIITESILKKETPLTEEDWVIIKQHPLCAFELLSPMVYLAPAVDIPYNHHERWDGSGYPRSLQGEQIPLSARIFAVVDVWDALTSGRPQRKAWPEAEAVEYLKEQSGKQFDPVVVWTFLSSNVKRKKVTGPLMRSEGTSSNLLA